MALADARMLARRSSTADFFTALRHVPADPDDAVRIGKEPSTHRWGGLPVIVQGRHRGRLVGDSCNHAGTTSGRGDGGAGTLAAPLPRRRVTRSTPGAPEPAPAPAARRRPARAARRRVGILRMSTGAGALRSLLAVGDPEGDLGRDIVHLLTPHSWSSVNRAASAPRCGFGSSRFPVGSARAR
jgi:hypothetical protein